MISSSCITNSRTRINPDGLFLTLDYFPQGKGKRHPIRYAIDGSNRWWQSPTLQNGRQYEWVTITIDLKQVREQPR
jgi:hypothetical protein